jgi:hypothetical protein
MDRRPDTRRPVVLRHNKSLAQALVPRRAAALPHGMNALEDVPRTGADIMDRVLEGLRQH